MPTVALAPMTDRLVHHADVVSLKGGPIYPRSQQELRRRMSRSSVRLHTDFGGH